MCNAPPAPTSMGACTNGYTGNNPGVCLLNGFRDCDGTPTCRACAPGVCCRATSLTLNPPVVPETCDNLDNDCDNVIDNGNSCSGGECASGWGYYEDGAGYRNRWKDFLDAEVR
ncbi:MAG: hypothetical protein IT290_03595 [Deltaproteobacteria bacterium]|nr:hypothetical protein [Deltaproteobacteria bacterium]